MGIGVLIIGQSGTGKSTSIRTLSQAGVINVIGKPLPFRDRIKTIITDDTKRITDIMIKCATASIVIDDAGYLLTNYYVWNHNNSGNKYQVFDELATSFFMLIDTIRLLHKRKIVYVMMHEDETVSGKIKPKTIGKMLDDKICIEGMFSIVLRSGARDGKYFFTTQSDGNDVAKSPMDMFKETRIENDLGLVDKTIREYYGLTQ
ncbi:MAG: ATP-binding protein [Treponema sp.]|nr:ATP-binding protein [Treponema sp.]